VEKLRELGASDDKIPTAVEIIGQVDVAKVTKE
jgi:hypothetical protein